MSTDTLYFLDFPITDDKSMPFRPKAYIALKKETTTVWRDEHGKKEIEFVTLSPECRTFEELQGWIDLLIRELKIIEKKGKYFFDKEMKKKGKYFAQKSKPTE